MKDQPLARTRIIWTLNIDATPIYAIQPLGAFSVHGYKLLVEFLSDQAAGKVERVSIPGLVTGKVTLLSGQTVPVIVPEIIGMYSWSISKLLDALAQNIEGGLSDPEKEGINNFLRRVYYELRNLGVSPQERALNFTGTNAYQAGVVFASAAKDNLELDGIYTEPSPISRPGANCWDVKLVFFDPKKRLERSRRVYRFTVDVTDVLPVTVGEFRTWAEY